MCIRDSLGDARVDLATSRRVELNLNGPLDQGVAELVAQGRTFQRPNDAGMHRVVEARECALARERCV